MQFSKMVFWTETKRRSKDCHPTVMNKYLCKAEGLCKWLGNTAVCMLGEKKVEIRSKRCIEINIKAHLYILKQALVFVVSIWSEYHRSELKALINQPCSSIWCLLSNCSRGRKTGWRTLKCQCCCLRMTKELLGWTFSKESLQCIAIALLTITDCFDLSKKIYIPPMQ